MAGSRPLRLPALHLRRVEEVHDALIAQRQLDREGVLHISLRVAFIQKPQRVFVTLFSLLLQSFIFFTFDVNCLLPLAVKILATSAFELRELTLCF